MPVVLFRTLGALWMAMNEKLNKTCGYHRDFFHHPSFFEQLFFQKLLFSTYAYCYGFANLKCLNYRKTVNLVRKKRIWEILPFYVHSTAIFVLFVKLKKTGSVNPTINICLTVSSNLCFPVSGLINVFSFLVWLNNVFFLSVSNSENKPAGAFQHMNRVFFSERWTTFNVN